MTYQGTVKNGVIVLPPHVALPEGAQVDVTICQDSAKPGSLADVVLKLAKPRSHLPADYALKHGHYVRGEPKK